MLPASQTCRLVLLLWCGAVARGAEDAAKDSGNAWETARRDLRELPSASRASSASANRLESGIQLPTLTPSVPGAKTSPLDAPSLSEPSQGWLLDALRSTDTQKGARSGGAARSERDSPDPLRTKTGSAPNPLSNYVEQWLLPQDRRLLVGEKRDHTALERAGIREEEPFRPKMNSDAKALTASSPERPSPMGERVNPYLTSTAPLENSPDPLGPPAHALGMQPALAPAASSSLEPPLYPAQWDTPANSNGPGLPKREAWVPPTAPLLDEHRYFPQLRRF